MNTRLLVVVLVVFAVLVTACQAAAPAPSPTPKPAPAPAPAPSPSPSPAATPTPAPSKTGAQYGGILRFGSEVDMTDYDNHLRPNNSPYLSIPVFNNLVRHDVTKRVLGPDTIVPDLATKWTVSPDGLTYTFELAKGVKWHDGKPFTADDVVYSLDKMADPKRSLMTGSFAAYKSAAKVDDYTVKVTLSRPQPSFLTMLGQGQANIQARHLAGTNPKSTAFLVGTGPFKYKSSVPGGNYELVRNPDYFGKAPNGDKLPYLDGMIVYVIKGRSAVLDALITKRLDMSDPDNGVISKEEEDRLKAQAPAVVQDWNYTQYLQSVNFNFDYKPLQDVRVRKALTLVVDRPKAIMAGFSYTKARFAESLLFNTAWGMPAAEAEKILGWDRPYADRVAEAKKLLAEAGYADGMKQLNAVTMASGALVNVCQAIADAWRVNLNVQVEVRPMATADLAARKLDRNFTMMRTAVTAATVGDPDEVLPSFQTGRPENITHYSNPQVDKLITQQSTEMDVAKRRAIVREIERLILNDYVFIPEGFPNFGTAYWPYVKGFVRQNANYSSHDTRDQMWMDQKDPLYAQRQQ